MGRELEQPEYKILRIKSNTIEAITIFHLSYYCGAHECIYILSRAPTTNNLFS